ncbi:ribonuclease H-like domain-containing protein, partial [Ampelomyces quisqualis]
KAKRKLRVRRLHDQILGPGRVFSGTISLPDVNLAREYDATRLGDVLANIKLGRALVYWTDGAFGGPGTKAGVMGAGVAWHDGSKYFTQSFHLGHGTGNHDDAELFAIAAALGKAKKKVQSGRGVQLVRIYSDSLSILEALRNGHAMRFGPMLSQRTALEGMYERADWLAVNGVAVTLIWVKAHSNSEGNRRADKAASAAVREQALVREQIGQGKIFTEADIPDVWRKLGPDWAEEWLFRA